MSLPVFLTEGRRVKIPDRGKRGSGTKNSDDIFQIFFFLLQLVSAIIQFIQDLPQRFRVHVVDSGLGAFATAAESTLWTVACRRSRPSEFVGDLLLDRRELTGRIRDLQMCHARAMMIVVR